MPIGWWVFTLFAASILLFSPPETKFPCCRVSVYSRPWFRIIHSRKYRHSLHVRLVVPPFLLPSQFDHKYGAPWHVIVGHHFASYISFEPQVGRAHRSDGIWWYFYFLRVEPAMLFWGGDIYWSCRSQLLKRTPPHYRWALRSGLAACFQTSDASPKSFFSAVLPTDVKREILKWVRIPQINFVISRVLPES